MNKFSAAVGDDVPSNTLLSSTAASASDVLILREVRPSAKHHQKIESASSKKDHGEWVFEDFESKNCQFIKTAQYFSMLE